MCVFPTKEALVGAYRTQFAEFEKRGEFEFLPSSNGITEGDHVTFCQKDPFDKTVKNERSGVVLLLIRRGPIPSREVDVDRRIIEFVIGIPAGQDSSGEVSHQDKIFRVSATDPKTVISKQTPKAPRTKS